MKSKTKHAAPPAGHAHADAMPDASMLPRCPNCGWHNVRFSKSKGLDRIVSRIGVKPFRCRSCGHRFYRFYQARA